MRSFVMFGLSLMALLLASGCEEDSGGSNTFTGGQRDEYGNCWGSSGQQCTGVEEFSACVMEKCDKEMQDVFGPNYKNKDFTGGKCSELIKCQLACNCGDTTCEQGCLTKMTSDCQSASLAFAQCMDTSGCKKPECGVPNAGDDACKQLENCCNQMQAMLKDACLSGLESYKSQPNSEASCSTALDGYKKSKMCE